MDAIISGLEFNCPGEAVENKKIHDIIVERYEQNLNKIYNQGNRQENSDIWGFFRDEVHRCIEKDTNYCNILVIFTDGYLRYDGRKDSKLVNTTSIQPQYLFPYRRPDWSNLIDRDKVSIAPCQENLQNLEILVLEIKGENSFVDEENILIYLWEEWLKKMGVKENNYLVLKSALPSMRKIDIEYFLNQK